MLRAVSALFREEGTWTPTLAGSTTAGTHTYSASTAGRYTRVGNLVIATWTLNLTSKDAAAAGSVRILGLPYAAVSGNPTLTVGALQFGNVTLPAGCTQAFVAVTAGTTYLLVACQGSGAAASLDIATGLASNSYLRGSISYTVTGS